MNNKRTSAGAVCDFNIQCTISGVSAHVAHKQIEHGADVRKQAHA